MLRNTEKPTIWRVYRADERGPDFVVVCDTYTPEVPDKATESKVVARGLPSLAAARVKAELLQADYDLVRNSFVA